MRLLRFIGEDHRVIIALHFADDLNGASLQNDFLFTVEAVTRCKVRRISHMSFHGEVARSNALARPGSRCSASEAVAAHEQMVLLPKKNAEERPCSFIVKLAPRRNKCPPRSVERFHESLRHCGSSRPDHRDPGHHRYETCVAQHRYSRGQARPAERQSCPLVQLSGDTDDFSEDSCQRVNFHTRDTGGSTLMPSRTLDAI